MIPDAHVPRTVNLTRESHPSKQYALPLFPDPNYLFHDSRLTVGTMYSSTSHRKQPPALGQFAPCPSAPPDVWMVGFSEWLVAAHNTSAPLPTSELGRLCFCVTYATAFRARQDPKPVVSFRFSHLPFHRGAYSANLEYYACMQACWKEDFCPTVLFFDTGRLKDVHQRIC
jgi:hypothetical protein